MLMIGRIARNREGDDHSGKCGGEDDGLVTGHWSLVTGRFAVQMFMESKPCHDGQLFEEKPQLRRYTQDMMVNGTRIMRMVMGDVGLGSSGGEAFTEESLKMFDWVMWIASMKEGGRKEEADNNNRFMYKYMPVTW